MQVLVERTTGEGRPNGRANFPGANARHAVPLLVWDGADALATVDPDLASMVLGVLRDAASQAERFAVLVRRTPGVTAEPMMLSGLDGLL